MTNAGYESVSSQDKIVPPLRPLEPTRTTIFKLAEVLKEKKLSGLVGAHLPLDLTPMADEAARLFVLHEGARRRRRGGAAAGLGAPDSPTRHRR